MKRVASVSMLNASNVLQLMWGVLLSPPVLIVLVLSGLSFLVLSLCFVYVYPGVVGSGVVVIVVSKVLLLP